MVILNRFSAILLHCDSNYVLLLAAEFLAIPGPSIPHPKHLLRLFLASKDIFIF